MKGFYKEVYCEFLYTQGDDPNRAQIMCRREGPVVYGKKPDNMVVETIDGYGSLIGRIREERNSGHNEILGDLYLEKHFGKLRVYSYSKGWVEEGMWNAGRITERGFWKIERQVVYVEVHPTLKQLVTEVSFDQVKQYVKEQHIGLEEWFKLVNYFKQQVE